MNNEETFTAPCGVRVASGRSFQILWPWLPAVAGWRGNGTKDCPGADEQTAHSGGMDPRSECTAVLNLYPPARSTGEDVILSSISITTILRQAAAEPAWQALKTSSRNNGVDLVDNAAGRVGCFRYQQRSTAFIEKPNVKRCASAIIAREPASGWCRPRDQLTQANAIDKVTTDKPDIKVTACRSGCR